MRNNPIQFRHNQHSLDYVTLALASRILKIREPILVEDVKLYLSLIMTESES